MEHLLHADTIPDIFYELSDFILLQFFEVAVMALCIYRWGNSFSKVVTLLVPDPVSETRSWWLGPDLTFFLVDHVDTRTFRSK